MPSTRSRVAPWALTLAAGLMGVVLLGTVWTTYRAVQRTSDVVVRGQADVLREGLRVHMAATLEGDTPGEALAAMLEDYEDDGMRYAALLDRDGHIVAEVGEASPGRPLGRAALELAPGNLTEVGARVRAVLRLPARLGRRERDRGVRPRGPEVDGVRGRHVVLEFEPRAATELRTTAEHTLGLGALAAGGFVVVALGLVRWFLRRQALEQRLERDQRLASLGRMSAVLAHEIRNPLASLKGNAQLLAGALDGGDRHKPKADRVVAEAIRLEALCTDLLEFARTGELHRAAIDPVALVREAAAATRGGERVVVVADGAPASWSLDGARLRQVVANLLENALEAGDGEVTATVATRGGRLEIGVRDRGPGIADEDLARVFEPFFTRRTHGTGLGLAVARRLVELHGGTLTAGNADGGGARFDLSIPGA
jgi:two-component system sensor histidine kinase HydH